MEMKDYYWKLELIERDSFERSQTRILESHLSIFCKSIDHARIVYDQIVNRYASMVRDPESFIQTFERVLHVPFEYNSVLYLFLLKTFGISDTPFSDKANSALQRELLASEK
jgi:hypothetical protein